MGQQQKQSTLISANFALHHFSLYMEHIQSKSRKGKGISNRARNAGWQAHLGNKKTIARDIFTEDLLGSCNAKSVPPCFSLSTIFIMVSASLDVRHITNGHQYWKALKWGHLHRIPVKLGEASYAGALTVPSLIMVHRNKTTTHRGRTLSNL